MVFFMFVKYCLQEICMYAFVFLWNDTHKFCLGTLSEQNIKSKIVKSKKYTELSSLPLESSLSL